MSDSNTAIIGYVLKVASTLTLGVGLLTDMDFFGVPAIVASGGAVVAAISIADNVGWVVRRWMRYAKKMSDAAMDSHKTQKWDQKLTSGCVKIMLLSGPIYLYSFELQPLPENLSVTYLLTLEPFAAGIFLIGGPIFTAVVLSGRLILPKVVNSYAKGKI